jgi:hypothetical protein
MDVNQPELAGRGHRAAGGGFLHWRRLARAGRALKLSATVAGAGAGLVPLGDNRQLLADLVARVQAARDLGA